MPAKWLNRSIALGRDSYRQPMKAFREPRAGKSCGQVLLRLSKMFPTLVMHWENVCVRKCPRRGNCVVAVHGEVECTAPLDASSPREEHYRTNGKASLHLRHALVPDSVSSDVDGFIRPTCRGNDKADYISCDRLDAWWAVARRSCRDLERDCAICRCKLCGFPRREANCVPTQPLSADFGREDLAYMGKKRPAGVVEVVGMLIVAERTASIGSKSQEPQAGPSVLRRTTGPRAYSLPAVSKVGSVSRRKPLISNMAVGPPIKVIRIDPFSLSGQSRWTFRRKVADNTGSIIRKTQDMRAN